MDADAILRVVRVPLEATGKRADVFLQTQLRGTSRTRARAIIEKSAYTVEGRKLRPSDRLRGEGFVALWRPSFDERDEARPLPALYEDDHLLVIDKPPLMAVHPTARHHHRTVIKLLQTQRPGQFLALIHRLDRETSGVLLVAKTPEADRAFKRPLEDRSLSFMNTPYKRGVSALSEKVSKSYLAMTWGVPREGDVSDPLEPDTQNALRVKMRVAPPGTGLTAKTTVKVLETIGDRYALVECGLVTGRQHQIRVHLAAAGCPVVGDKLYGPDDRLLARAADDELTLEDLDALELPRHALHNHCYRLIHAITGEPLELRSPLPPDLQAFWDDKKTEPQPTDPRTS